MVEHRPEGVSVNAEAGATVESHESERPTTTLTAPQATASSASGEVEVGGTSA